MRADGEQVIPLTEVKGFAGVPSYAPDDKTIVFQWRPTNDFHDNEKWRICMMNADGGGFREITNGEANDQVPNWSRDGRRILFFSDRTGRNQIYSMKADGSDVRRIATNVFNDNASMWSPDGKWIAFSSERDGVSDLYVMRSNGTHVRRLTNTPATERLPVWSPDGRRIVFSADEAGDASGIFIMNADGSNRTRLDPKE
ncbi:MAG: TolB family protein [Thermoanaerobaculia bacterium]